MVKRINMENSKNLIGKKFGRLTVIKRDFSDKWGKAKWICECQCGIKTSVIGQNLRNGNTKSCGCLKKNRLISGIAMMRRTIKNYKRSAKEQGYEYTLTEEQFREITQKDCFYCGAKPNNIMKHPYSNGDYIYSGLDRVNNNLGYVIDNIVPCCKQCNQAKQKLTVEEFRDWVKKAYNRMWY